MEINAEQVIVPIQNIRKLTTMASTKGIASAKGHSKTGGGKKEGTGEKGYHSKIFGKSSKKLTPGKGFGAGKKR